MGTYHWRRLLVNGTLLLIFLPATARATERLCDPSFEDCRTPILQLIRNERIGIDVAFWFMEDARYTAELIKRAQAGVRVRVLVDPRANVSNPLNADRLNELAAAGIPMRKRTASGILHWKMMLFDGQNTVEFSAANYSPEAYVPEVPYQNYIDEVVYFTDQASIVNSFRTNYDTLWTDTVRYANYANITNGSLTRRYDTFLKDPELNFPPEESYRSRAVKQYDLETAGLDVIMFRITDAAHADAMIRAVQQRHIRVRLITEQQQYRDPTRLWHSYNVDRMYAAGVQIRHRGHAGLVHQKSVILHALKQVIWGSSNWSSPSSDSQQEHNHFTKKFTFYQYFVDQFERKWTNGAGFTETVPFTPLPPDKPVYTAPANLATDQSTTSLTLRWKAGFWAHKYDVYLGTTAQPPLLIADLPLGPSQSAGELKTYTVTGVKPGTTYYWKIVSKTMANLSRVGSIFSFTTSGTTQSSAGTLGPGDILLYAAHASVRAGAWQVQADSAAAGGARMTNPDAARAKVSPALASPADYFQLTFTASANVPYHLWMRMRAQGDSWANDSVHVQFSDAINSSGARVYGIGTTSSAEVNLEDCGGCGLSGWGWQDNGWGINVAGPGIVFSSSGTHTIRVQRREDGVSIDQILLSPQKYLSASPGTLKNDTVKFPESTAGAALTASASGAAEMVPATSATEMPGDCQAVTTCTGVATIDGVVRSSAAYLNRATRALMDDPRIPAEQGQVTSAGP